MKKINIIIFISLFILISCKTKKEIVDKKENITDKTDSVISKQKLNDKKIIASKYINYKPERALKNKLIHTKLELSFNFVKQDVIGKATLRLQPYYYSTDKVVLDAKNFIIKNVEIKHNNQQNQLKYQYNNHKLRINLDREYSKDETYTLVIKYIADLPENTKRDDQGFYFIRNKKTGKVEQIWTQGETEYSSCWFPTIDSPNQRCTQEILATVPLKFKTLSNGLLKNSLVNTDSTRTDYWKQDKPHAPYLFTFVAGEFEYTETEWHEIPVTYYTPKKSTKTPEQLFGKTTEMIDFFSTKFDYPYPWDKYAQVVVKDFVSGAMENTSATTFGDFIYYSFYSDAEIESIVAHELAHQWFGNLITCESWANLSLNESFATYCEYLWFEHKYGKDVADIRLYQDRAMCKYNQHQPIVDYYYEHPDDMFNTNNYQKGAQILHSLRNYIGDDAFFTSIQKYLKHFAYKSTEIDDLRLVFEEVTGLDLHLFFKQWFYTPSFPKVKFHYKYYPDKNQLVITSEQKTKHHIYKIPIDFKIYTKSTKTISSKIILHSNKQSDTLQINHDIDFIDFNPGKITLMNCEEKLKLSDYYSIFRHSEYAVDKLEAYRYISDNEKKDKIQSFFIEALRSKIRRIRYECMNDLKNTDWTTNVSIIEQLDRIKKSDPDEKLRNKAEFLLKK